MHINILSLGPKHPFKTDMSKYVFIIIIYLVQRNSGNRCDQVHLESCKMWWKWDEGWLFSSRGDILIGHSVHVTFSYIYLNLALVDTCYRSPRWHLPHNVTNLGMLSIINTKYDTIWHITGYMWLFEEGFRHKPCGLPRDSGWRKTWTNRCSAKASCSWLDDRVNQNWSTSNSNYNSLSVIGQGHRTVCCIVHKLYKHTYSPNVICITLPMWDISIALQDKQASSPTKKQSIWH